MKLMVLLTTVALACFGCAHTQPPERKVYVIAEADEAGAEDGPGTGGAGADAYCNEMQIECYRQ